jgi:steroid 5-alpha reductase family enzyme
MTYRIGGNLAGTSRPAGFAVVTLAYLVAGLAAWAVVAALDGPGLLVTLYADLAATLVVFAASTLVANASLYDPYWSVAPAVIVIAWVLSSPPLTGRQAAALVLVLAWSARLTANWVISWRGLSHEDWRYVQLREQRRPGVPWWLINLAGIQLMPTLVVFAGLLAVWPATTVTGRPWNPLDVAAVAVTAGAILLEATADRQLHRFTGDPANRGAIIDRGLWRHSRHPNYLGEIVFWWGMWLFGLAAAPDWWWTIIGPVVMVLLFTFVSVPMMDRRSLIRRPAYAEHMRHVPALLPRPSGFRSGP